MCASVLRCFSPVQLFTTPRTIARQAPLSMGFSRHEYCSGLPCPPPGTLPDPGIKTMWVLYHYCLLRSPNSNVDGQNSAQQNLFILQNPERICHVNICRPEKQEEILFLLYERKPRCGAVQKLYKEHSPRITPELMPGPHCRQ